jgi:hypothetical protein
VDEFRFVLTPKELTTSDSWNWIQAGLANTPVLIDLTRILQVML